MIKQLMIMALFLAACSGAAPPATPEATLEATDEATDEATIATVFQPFMATIEGVEKKVLVGLGYFQCLDAVSADETGISRFAYQEIAIDLRTEDAISFILPANVGLGTYTLNSPSNAPAGLDFTAQVVLGPGAIYDQDVSGTLTLEALAKAPGEAVRGAFAFSASNGIDSIDVSGSFDFVASEDTRYCTVIDSAP